MNYPISPSQLKTYTACPRKWAFDKLDGLRTPPGPGAELGSKVHAHVEAWLINGTPPIGREPAVKLAAELVRHLPAPTTGIVEGAYQLARPHVTFAGRIDFIHLPTRTVFDHKTTSSLRYALTEGDLAEDFQGVQYAGAFLAGYGGEDVNLQWTYVQTKGRPEVLPVRAKVTRKHVETRLAEQETIARDLVTLRVLGANEGLRAQDVPGNTDACGDFGGCPFYGRQCNPNEERERNIMSSLKERIAQRKAQQGEKAEAPPAAPPAPAPAAEEAPKVNPPKLSIAKKTVGAAAAETAATNKDTRGEAALAALGVLLLVNQPKTEAEMVAMVGRAWVIANGVAGA